jgi:RHS repeat-associated protein
LGNVLVTVNDKKLGVSSNDSTVDYFNPQVVSAQDYYPFGMLQVGRELNDSTYRYGFNGQEMSNEIKGSCNSYTALFWEYDPRTGRRWNLDPVIKSGESPYSTFHNNSIFFNDPLGDDPPKKPGILTRIWRGMNMEYYKTRAEEYANANNIDEKNIVDLGNTWVVINDKNPQEVRFSIFRQSKKDLPITTPLTSSENDDVNLTTSQLLNTDIKGYDVLPAPMPGSSVGSGAILMGGKSRQAILGVVDKTAKALQSFEKYIRFGKEGHPDLLKKGFHLHFDEIVNELEMALRPLEGGKIGLIQVGKLSVGTANDIKKSVEVFSKAMANPKFRAELLVRLIKTQQYVKEAFKFTRDAQLAIDKAHELNFLIKAVQKF